MLGAAVIVVLGVLSLSIARVLLDDTTTSPGTSVVTPSPIPASSSNGSAPSASPSVRATTSATMTPTPSPKATPSPTPSVKVTPTPTPVPSPSRAHPTATVFANPGYQPPAPPAGEITWPYPKTKAETTEWLNNNPVYGAGVSAPINCPYDPVVKAKNPDPAQLEVDVNRVIDCMMAAWDTPVRAAGYTLTRPRVALFSGTINTPCGQLSTARFPAMYCQANAVIYLPYEQKLSTRPDGLPTYVVELMVAHEFGHHLQARTGFLAASNITWQQGWQDPLDMSRRLELQATCFGGQSIRAVAYSFGLTADDLKVMQADQSDRGDQPGRVRDHGSPANNGAWYARGLADLKVGACRTFTAPADQVS